MERSPVCSVVGHVDHGKSTILDFIRRSNVVSKEAGAITQAIGASFIPAKTITNLCGNLLTSLKIDLTLPGLLFIDTPGHAAFTSLRKRGGNLADIAIVTIDINEGIKPQTEESIKILQSYKTPFVIALNKIDRLKGFSLDKKKGILENISLQNPKVSGEVDKRIYEIVGKLHELFGLESERFDRVSDHTKQIVMVPCSAKEGVGIPELLMMLIGLAQKYLSGSLQFTADGPAKGTILEVKDERGLGTTLDAIIYDGTLKVGDTIVIGGINEPKVVKVKALLEPDPLSEMRDKRSKFKSVKSVVAANGVKISAKDIDDVIAGMPFMVPVDLESAKKEIQTQISEVLFDTDEEGIVVKADSLGSLEAMVKLMRENDIAIRRASVGNITKHDLIDAESSSDPFCVAVLGFNVKCEEKSETVKVITAEVIYEILDRYTEWVKEKKIEQKAKELDKLNWPAKFEIMKGYVFRQNNPAVVGVDVLMGKLTVGCPVMKEGEIVSLVKQIQSDNKAVSSIEQGKQVAVSLPNVSVGRQIKEEDVLYTAITEDEFRTFKEYKEYLDGDVNTLLKEIAEIMRRNNPVWGV